MNLFENLYEEKKPLAFRYRPKTLEDFYGQEKLVGEKGVLKRIIEKGTFMNSIFQVYQQLRLRQIHHQQLL